MLDVENWPVSAVRLAAGCMVHCLTVPLLMQAGAQHVAAFAPVCGLTFAELLEAVDWFSEYTETHPPLGMTAN